MLDIDQAVYTAFSARAAPGYEPFFGALTLLGSAYLWVGAVTLYLVFGQHKKIAAVLLIALVAGMIANDDIKDIVGRPRPDGVTVGSYFTHHYYSFPSGHTEMAFIVATVLSAFVARRYAPALFLMAAAIGASRLYLGVHFFTDVAGGAAIGTLIGIMAIVGFTRLGWFGGKGLPGIGFIPGKIPEKGVFAHALAKYAAIITTAGLVTSMVALLMGWHFLSLASLGIMFIAVLALPSYLKTPQVKKRTV